MTPIALQGSYTWQRTRTFWPFLELTYEVRDFTDRADPYKFTASSAAVGFRNEVGERTHFRYAGWTHGV